MNLKLTCKTYIFEKFQPGLCIDFLPGVFGAPEDLQPGGQDPRQVAESEGDESVDGQGLVHVVHGNVVPQLPQKMVRPGQRPTDLLRIKKKGRVIL